MLRNLSKWFFLIWSEKRQCLDYTIIFFSIREKNGQFWNQVSSKILQLHEFNSELMVNKFRIEFMKLKHPQKNF